MAKGLNRRGGYERSMSLKNYLTTFELTSERERKLFRDVGSELSGLYDSVKQLYQKTPAVVRAGALVGLGVLGTVAYQEVRERAEAERKVWIEYHHGGTGDSKDRPYEYRGFVTRREWESIREDRYIKVNYIDLGRE